MLLQARCPYVSIVLTVLEDTHVLLLSEDGIVSLQAVLLEHLLITAIHQPLLSRNLNACRSYPKPVECHTSVVTHQNENRVIRTKNVEERVLQAEKLISVGSHCVMRC
jgi:hypothetical protein